MTGSIALTDPVLAYINYIRHEENVSFDLDYYVKKHVPMAKEFWKEYGLLGMEVVQFAPDDPSGRSKLVPSKSVMYADIRAGLFIQTITRWESLAAWEKGFAAIWTNEALINDIENYWPDRPTDVEFMTRFVAKCITAA